jgi:predicted dehydrogenase
MAELRIGLVGSGFMGRTHAEAVAKYTHGARLVAVTGGTHAIELAQDYGIAEEESLEALLTRSDVDAVIVSTPQHVHAEQVVLAAHYRKHVLVEKPMAASVDDCRAMNRACGEAGVTLMVAFTQRFRRGNMEAKRLIDSGAIGPVRMIRETMVGVDGRRTYPRWQQSRENGGTLLGYGVHSIDRIRWFAGSEVESVMAHSVSPLEAEVEYSSMVFLQLANGISASLLCDMECPAPGFPHAAFHSWVIGQTGILDLDAYGELRMGTEGTWRVLFQQEQIDWQKDGKFSPVRMQSFRDQDQEFIESVAEGRVPQITGIDGERAVEVALAAYASSGLRRSVNLLRTA